MSAHSTWSSSECCTNRAPPSPDGHPPRPTISSKVTQRANRDSLSSCSTSKTDAIVLCPIFEEGRTDAAALFRLEPLLLADKSDSDDESVDEAIETKRSSSTFSCVTQKLRKHLSIDSTLLKRRSKSSTRTTDEEADRRAELRRIRNRRIQEELSNDTIYDDDARSLSPFSDGNISLAHSTQSSTRAQEPCVAGPLLSLDTCPLVYPTLPFHELPSLDGQNDVYSPAAQYAVNEESETLVPLPELNPSELDNEQKTALEAPQFGRHMRELSAIPPIPSAPVLQPKRLPSITEPPRSSWRLSFASSNRGEVLRNLSVVCDMSDVPDLKSSNVSRLSLGAWLHSQSLRSPSSPTLSSEEKMVSGSSDYHSRPCSDNQDFVGSGDGVEQNSPLHLYEMDIPRRLASSGLQASSSFTHLSSRDSHNPPDSCVLDTPQPGKIQHPAHSESVSLTEEITQLWDQIVEDGPSCIYSPATHRTRSTVETSNVSGACPPPEDRIKPCILDLGRADPSGGDTFLGIIIPPDSHSAQLTPTRPIRKPIADNISILVSETESFREREGEPSLIQNRFLHRQTGNCSSTPMSSKFREEFNLDIQPPKSWIPHKSLIFSRLSKFVTRPYDGRTSAVQPLSMPMPDPTPIDLVKTHSLGSEPTNENRVWDLKSKFRLRRTGERGSGESDESKARLLLGALGGIAWTKKKHDGKPISNEDKTAANESRNHLASTTAPSKSYKEKVFKQRKTAGPDLKFPAAWASYPSHPRRERSLSTSFADSIDVKDFALKSSNIEDHFYGQPDKGRYRSLGDTYGTAWDGDAKLTIELKAQVNMNLTTVGSSAIGNTFHGRNSPSSLDVDYPKSGGIERLPMHGLPIKTATATPMAKTRLARRDGQSTKRSKNDILLGESDTIVDGVFGSRIREAPLQTLDINIGDPAFYEDCVVSSAADQVEQSSSKRNKSSSSGGERYNYGTNKRENISLGSRVLRESTEE